MLKKINTLLIVILMLFTIVSCKEENIEIPEESDMDLTTLPYFEYLGETNPVITITVKDFGTMTAELFPSVAENTVNNFIEYITNEDFTNSSFHRIIKGFMIQGGMVSNTRRSIKGEFASNGFNNPLKHDKGVLSMARTMVSNSATSQFFVMHQKSPHLDGAYASFGGLIKGFDILDKIAGVKTNYQDGPLEKVVIESVTIDLRGYEPKEVIYA